MYLNGTYLHLVRRQGMWHLLVGMGNNLTSVLLESSSSTRRRPKWSYIRRHNQMLILLLEGSNLHWLITIFPNTQLIRCQTMPSPSTGSLDI
ncbi:non-structural protein [Orthobunyavirus simbuense]|uniref:Non-structural protein NS-S n=1 Tax=Simbu virus TaxID=3052441 RepID=Q8QZ52_SIMBU|nr:non-structural protein [Orthobunyavirus simbuense]AAL78242.1 non-structural protein [Orthobunyavirus simbuense]QCR98105.1 NSs [Orthobunyavirus simbuense]CCG93498.1 non-structural protein [Orthobunyavirus simbuense]